MFQSRLLILKMWPWALNMNMDVIDGSHGNHLKLPAVIKAITKSKWSMYIQRVPLRLRFTKSRKHPIMVPQQLMLCVNDAGWPCIRQVIISVHGMKRRAVMPRSIFSLTFESLNLQDGAWVPQPGVTRRLHGNGSLAPGRSALVCEWPGMLRGGWMGVYDVFVCVVELTQEHLSPVHQLTFRLMVASQ